MASSLTVSASENQNLNTGPVPLAHAHGSSGHMSLRSARKARTSNMPRLHIFPSSHKHRRQSPEGLTGVGSVCLDHCGYNRNTSGDLKQQRSLLSQGWWLEIRHQSVGQVSFLQNLQRKPPSCSCSISSPRSQDPATHLLSLPLSFCVCLCPSVASSPHLRPDHLVSCRVTTESCSCITFT